MTQIILQIRTLAVTVKAFLFVENDGSNCQSLGLVPVAEFTELSEPSGVGNKLSKT